MLKNSFRIGIHKIVFMISILLPNFMTIDNLTK